MLSISKEEERLQKSMLNIMYGTLYTAQKPNLHIIVVHVSQVPTALVTYNVHPRNPWQQLTCTVVHANCQLRFDSLTVLTVLTRAPHVQLQWSSHVPIESLC